MKTLNIVWYTKEVKNIELPWVYNLAQFLGHVQNPIYRVHNSKVMFCPCLTGDGITLSCEIIRNIIFYENVEYILVYNLAQFLGHTMYRIRRPYCPCPPTPIPGFQASKKPRYNRLNYVTYIYIYI